MANRPRKLLKKLTLSSESVNTSFERLGYPGSADAHHPEDSQ